MDSTNTATSTDHTSKKHKHKASGQQTKYHLPTKKPMIRHKQVWYQARVLGTTATRVTLGKLISLAATVTWFTSQQPSRASRVSDLSC